MATNNDYRGERLRVEDLKIGQTLIEVQFGRWSNPVHEERRWEITRVTKTRVVITLLREVEGVDVLTTVHERMIARDGLLTTQTEGKYSSTKALYTEDDPSLPVVRAQTERSKRFLLAQRAAETAHSRLSVETAQSAITALQAFIDGYPGDET